MAEFILYTLYFILLHSANARAKNIINDLSLFHKIQYNLVALPSVTYLLTPPKPGESPLVWHTTFHPLLLMNCSIQLLFCFPDVYLCGTVFHLLLLRLCLCPCSRPQPKPIYLHLQPSQLWPIATISLYYLAIIPRARIGLMGYWLRGQEGERNNCFSNIQLVSQKYRDKTTLAS